MMEGVCVCVWGGAGGGWHCHGTIKVCVAVRERIKILVWFQVQISEDFSCIGYHLTEYGGVFGD